MINTTLLYAPTLCPALHIWTRSMTEHPHCAPPLQARSFLICCLDQSIVQVLTEPSAVNAYTSYQCTLWCLQVRRIYPLPQYFGAAFYMLTSVTFLLTSEFVLQTLRVDVLDSTLLFPPRLCADSYSTTPPHSVRCWSVWERILSCASTGRPCNDCVNGMFLCPG
jgi:hypothetical protein